MGGIETEKREDLMTRLCGLLLSAVLLAASAPAVEKGADSILKEAAGTYKKAETYQDRSEMVVEMSFKGMENKITIPFDLKVKKPGMMNLKSDSPLLGFIFAADGKSMWIYRKSSNEYRKLKEEPLLEVAKDGVGPLGMMKSPILLSTIVADDPLAEIEEDVTSKKIAGTETVDGAECDVIEMTQTGSTARIWVDRKRKLIVKLMMDMGGGGESPGGDAAPELTITEYHKDIRLDTEIPDAEFAFSPPEGAKLVEAFTREKKARTKRERVNLAGKPAPELELTDLDGKKHSLGDLKGKVVLIDFWASWCPPCRRELPHVQKIHEELGPKGLVVLGVNAEKDEAKLKKFLEEQKVTFPVLRDTDRKASKAYSVTAIPRVLIIGRDGTVAADFTGMKSEEVLREALANAGIAKETGGKDGKTAD